MLVLQTKKSCVSHHADGFKESKKGGKPAIIVSDLQNETRLNHPHHCERQNWERRALAVR